MLKTLTPPWVHLQSLLNSFFDPFCTCLEVWSGHPRRPVFSLKTLLGFWNIAEGICSQQIFSAIKWLNTTSIVDTDNILPSGMPHPFFMTPEDCPAKHSRRRPQCELTYHCRSKEGCSRNTGEFFGCFHGVSKDYI